MCKQGKQERRQESRERLGPNDVPMTPEKFSAVVEAYIGQRLRECDSCENDTLSESHMTKREFLAAKSALLEILTDSGNTPSQRLRAAELLPTLVETFEKLQWSFVI